MKRRIFLTTILLGSCSVEKIVHLTKENFDRKHIIGSDNKGNYYLEYKLSGMILDKKNVTIRIDSTKIDQYEEGDYILILPKFGDEQIYRKKYKIYNFKKF